ncbi:MAG: molybdopterin molybdotransferase MoeA [Rhizobiales bacterium]|nr:molybdopterin molybdotransferase MoeA [Hyphomicrobiales bacterium]MBI3672185.1 molybdopterin molybdotransferase MoeA [Hyphomicrobiales bacterium]
MGLIPVAEARARILAKARPLAAEQVELAEAMGRVLAAAATARRDQPPFAASAMDGYAVRAADVAKVPTRLEVIGVSAAGHGLARAVRPGEAARIFTGAPMPRGADTVVIQENTEAGSPSSITVLEPARAGRNVRGRGLDFARGDLLLPAGIRLNARDIGLAAAANVALLRVRRKPRVAIFVTGDELVEPGERLGPGQVVSSNRHGLALLARHCGAEVVNLGIVRDSLAATRRAIARAAGADILVTTGGASVGDHDFVQEGLKQSGVKLDFWKIAMRPGKPFMYGRKGRQHVLGLPGNPVSAMVCARLFLKPLLDALQGLATEEPETTARLGAGMKANDGRQDHVRARLAVAADGSRVATPFAHQDSSMQRTFREAQCLIIRPPQAPEAPEGTPVPILILDF